MSLSTKAVDRIFQRLAATYGERWDRSLGSAPMGDVKAAWAHELAGFAEHLTSIAWALEHLPDRCPNVIEFRNLCRKAPAPELPRLPEPEASPERLRAELAKLADVRKAARAGGDADPRAWARRIVARAEAGQPVSSLPLRLAREALGLEVAA